MVSHIIPNSSSPSPTQPCYRKKEPAVSIVQECTILDCGCLLEGVITISNHLSSSHSLGPIILCGKKQDQSVSETQKLPPRTSHLARTPIWAWTAQATETKAQSATKEKDWVFVGDIVIILMAFSGGPLRKSKEPRTHVPTNKAGNPNLETAKTAWEESISELFGCRENWLDFHTDNLVSKISYWHSLLWGFLPELYISALSHNIYNKRNIRKYVQSSSGLLSTFNMSALY